MNSTNTHGGTQASVFDDDSTLRWSPRKGDYVLWVAPRSLFSADRESSWGIPDFWQMRDGDFVTITNRWADVPAWFELHPLDVADAAAYEMARRLEAGYKPGDRMEAPNVWKVKAGDRLVWVSTDLRHPISCLLDMRACALVLVENTQLEFDPTPDDGPRSDAVRTACHVGFKAAVGLGVPREFSVEWKFGA